MATNDMDFVEFLKKKSVLICEIRGKNVVIIIRKIRKPVAKNP
jgi:hypothetical protein